MIFTNGSMINNGSSSSSTQQVGMAELFQSRTTSNCYDLKFLESDNRTTLVLSNTKELDRELFYKLVYLYSLTGGLY